MVVKQEGCGFDAQVWLCLCGVAACSRLHMRRTASSEFSVSVTVRRKEGFDPVFKTADVDSSITPDCVISSVHVHIYRFMDQ